MPDAARRRVITLVAATVAAAALAIAAFVLPVPYVELSPGKTCDTLTSCPDDSTPILSIKGAREYPTDGQLRLTTVGVYGAPGSSITLWTALRGWFNHKVAILPRDITFPPQQSSEENACQNFVDQQQSQNNAITAALRQLRYEVPVTTQVYAAGLPSGSAARRAGLETCDVITRVDGVDPKNAKGLVALIQAHKPGDVVVVDYARNNGDATTTGRLRVRLGADPDNPQRALLGVKPAEAEISHPPFTVKLDLRNVGGPSAGLMFALAIIDRLTPGSLTGGKVIAGTGTIDDKGAVGEIGGVQQKVFAAKRDGASVFLTPAGDCADAARVHVGGVRLVSVDSLGGALDALAALRGQGGAIKDCKG